MNSLIYTLDYSTIQYLINANGGITISKNDKGIQCTGYVNKLNPKIKYHELCSLLQVAPYKYIQVPETLAYNEGIIISTINGFSELLNNPENEKYSSCYKNIIAVLGDILLQQRKIKSAKRRR